MINNRAGLEQMLSALGEQLSAAGVAVSIVIVGGAAMNMLGYVARPTKDVDVLAKVGAAGLAHPDPLPEALTDAIRQVAVDFQQPEDWMNTVTAGQWETGLPPGLESRVVWLPFGGLQVGVASREDLITLKLYAAADHPGLSVHLSDLLSLEPTIQDLRHAAVWVKTQDASAEFHEVVDRVRAHVEARIA